MKAIHPLAVCVAATMLLVANAGFAGPVDIANRARQEIGAPTATATSQRNAAEVGSATAISSAAASGVHGTGNGARADQARITAANGSLGALSKAVTAVYLDVARLPSASEGLNILLVQPAGLKTWRGPYISRVSWKDPFSDPWGNPYRYINTTPTGKNARPSFEIKSNGPDGLPDTADDLSVKG
ncbi:MAG: type II secretion system protein GspG [Candidatus Sumerlaeaceae bacterium]|nr:type II secretion system protein GspG [Candidatus Sumerlaeaceae bacterium]